ncbi:MAG TPA: ATPase, T2SS/T4P/T4SS family [Noviherbaspirillum sp.]|jgi:pilus assembly protein CpaF|uniref:ATPase, T2SS/T4P/T4SS family n=1 Tax=Noviherbaspirillum sp. TaxID=1926288 RepID=UPI002F95390D
MLKVNISDPDGRKRTVLAPDDCVIGKGAQSEIRLDSWRVSKEHARLYLAPAGVLIDDLGGFGGVSVNGKRIEIQYGPLKASDAIGIGPFILHVQEPVHSPLAVEAASPFSLLDIAARDNRGTAEEIDPSRREAVQVQSAVFQARDDVVSLRADGAGEKPAGERKETGRPVVVAPDFASGDREFDWRKRIHSKLLETMDLRRQDISVMSDDLLRSEAEALVRQIVAAESDHIPRDLDRALLCKQVLDEAVGLGPLEELLDDQSVTEVMVNRFDEIYVERGGKLTRYPLAFTGDRAVLGVIERIVAPLGRRIDESSPMVDARLKDGSRVNAIIPPLAVKGPALTIRKFSENKLEASDLVAFGAISQEMAEFLKVCVETRKNIVVSGGTGSGKTTLLNILSNFIPARERVITVEDAAELKLHHAHLVRLEARPANTEGKGTVSIRDLVKNTLRMRPDRIVIGECRGAEALDMLQAMNTGHEGSLTTLHANSPRDALARLETMVLMAGVDLPLLAIREQVASAVDLIVQQTRFACGSRKVTAIAEISGMESGRIQVQDIFKYVHEAYGADGRVSGYFTGCGLVPGFYESLRVAGRAPDVGIFRLGTTRGVTGTGDEVAG